jgi:hypothetical protein
MFGLQWNNTIEREEKDLVNVGYWLNFWFIDIQYSIKQFLKSNHSLPDYCSSPAPKFLRYVVSCRGLIETIVLALTIVWAMEIRVRRTIVQKAISMFIPAHADTNPIGQTGVVALITIVRGVVAFRYNDISGTIVVGYCYRAF